MPFSLLIIPHLKLAQSGKWSLMWKSQDEAMLFCQKNPPSLNITSLEHFTVLSMQWDCSCIYNFKCKFQTFRFDHLIKWDFFFSKAQKAGSDLLSFHMLLLVGNSGTWRTYKRGLTCACNFNFHMYWLWNAWCCKWGSTDWKPHLKCNMF